MLPHPTRCPAPQLLRPLALLLGVVRSAMFDFECQVWWVPQAWKNMRRAKESGVVKDSNLNGDGLTMGGEWGGTCSACDEGAQPANLPCHWGGLLFSRPCACVFYATLVLLPRIFSLRLMCRPSRYPARAAGILHSLAAPG